MMCYHPSGCIIFSLRKLKFYWGRGPDMRVGGRGPDNPNTLRNYILKNHQSFENLLKKHFSRNKKYNNFPEFLPPRFSIFYYEVSWTNSLDSCKNEKSYNTYTSVINICHWSNFGSVLILLVILPFFMINKTKSK